MTKRAVGMSKDDELLDFMLFEEVTEGPTDSRGCCLVPVIIVILCGAVLVGLVILGYRR